VSNSFSCGEFADGFQGGLHALASEWGKVFAEREVLDRNGDPLRVGAMAKNLFGELEEGAGIGGVSHDLTHGHRFDVTGPNSSLGINRGVHEDNMFRGGNEFSEFGGKLMAGKRGHSVKVPISDGFGDLRAHAIVAAEFVAVADYQEAVARVNAGSSRHK